jgi:hypothetical protein
VTKKSQPQSKKIISGFVKNVQINSQTTNTRKNMAEKEYLISMIRKKIFDNGGSVLNCSFKLDDLEQHANEDGWINITISKRREVSDKGATHYAFRNEYKPKTQEPKQAEQAPHDDNLPF